MYKNIDASSSYNKTLFWNGTDRRRNNYCKQLNISINYTIKQCMKQWKGYTKDGNCELVFTFITYVGTEWEKNISVSVFILLTTNLNHIPFALEKEKHRELDGLPHQIYWEKNHLCELHVQSKMLSKHYSIIIFHL